MLQNDAQFSKKLCETGLHSVVMHSTIGDRSLIRRVTQSLLLKLKTSEVKGLFRLAHSSPSGQSMPPCDHSKLRICYVYYLCACRTNDLDTTNLFVTIKKLCLLLAFNKVYLVVAFFDFFTTLHGDDSESLVLFAELSFARKEGISLGVSAFFQL